MHKKKAEERRTNTEFRNRGDTMEVKSFGEIVPEKKRFGVDEKVTFAQLIDKEFIVKDRKGTNISVRAVKPMLYRSELR